MYQDVLLFLPNTQFSAERMGLDFAMPVSQVCNCVLCVKM